MIKFDDLPADTHLHFIGIGGSGMYPLVQIMHRLGYYITGSDNNETETLEAVRAMGIKVFLGHKKENIGGADVIVYTAAVLDGNPEMLEAEQKGLKILERSDLLGMITGQFEKPICISGTHGKTTATAMLTQIFLEESMDISCVIGGKLRSIGGSGRYGNSGVIVCEACEFKDHFLKLSSDVSVILNIDADHLDYFGTLENIIKSFHKFAADTGSTVIVNGDDENSLKAVEGVDKEIVTFGFDRKNDYSAKIIETKGLRTVFTLYYKGEAVDDMAIYVPGTHNVLNALAAAAAARTAGVSYDGISMGLQVFRGAVRRFEKIGEKNGVTVVDDYAHHPAEIAATLKAAKSLDFKRVWAVFQPFTYSRTELLMDDFVKALEIADKVVLTDIMGSREKNTRGIYTEDLGKRIDGAVWFNTPHDKADEQSAVQKEYNFSQVTDYIAANAGAGDLVITMGCGDVYKAAKQLAEKL